MSRCDLGVVGLGTMGRALLQNLNRRGNAVAGYDVDTTKVEALNADGPGVEGFHDLGKFVAAIRRPRAILILVPAGAPVDNVASGLVPALEEGDFIIDGGNSHYRDTSRRILDLSQHRLGFMGMGISGGEKGARNGPSLMPGGRPEDYERVRPLLESIAARFGDEPCVAHVGLGAAGHYVKTVHNGIEYALMQALAEAYDLLRRGLGLPEEQVADTFGRWNIGPLQSYLVEITQQVLRQPNDQGEGLLIDFISDQAGSKGTGKWTSQDAMDLGIPVPMIDAAVSARQISAMRSIRDRAAMAYPADGFHGDDAQASIAALESGLWAAFLLAYAQGLHLIAEASAVYGFRSDLRRVVRIWRAGCIIRSRMLEDLREAVDAAEGDANVLLAPSLVGRVTDAARGLRETVARAAALGVPTPVLSAGLAYFDAYRSARLPSALIQGQRDLFGAHGFQRIDAEGTFHAAWEADAEA